MSSFLVLCEGDTRNRWRDGQVCPDVGQGTMAPWARRLGCVLACYAQIRRGRSRETLGREKEAEKEREGDGKREKKKREEREETEKDKKKSREERREEPALYGEKG
ncbi:hypothetical protein TNCV_654481 [Trichonephila clavipes]|nr:hypothetical protein TNCV_654481 [Trichonephila clavipes]